MQSDSGRVADVLGIASKPGDQPGRQALQVQAVICQRFRQDQRLLGVVGDFPGIEPQPATTDELGNAGGEPCRDLIAFEKLEWSPSASPQASPSNVPT